MAARIIADVAGGEALGDFHADFAEELASLGQIKDGSEVAVLKRLVRRLLGDVRRLALAPPQLADSPAGPPTATGEWIPLR